jgi:hypothetical protein
MPARHPNRQQCAPPAAAGDDVDVHCIIQPGKVEVGKKTKGCGNKYLIPLSFITLSDMFF